MQLNQRYWIKNNFIAKTLKIVHTENVLRLLEKQNKYIKQNVSTRSLNSLHRRQKLKETERHQNRERGIQRDTKRHRAAERQK